MVVRSRVKSVGCMKDGLELSGYYSKTYNNKDAVSFDAVWFLFFKKII